MLNDNNILHAQFLAAMTAAPMPEYALDLVVQDRVGRFFVKQADEAETLRRVPK
jgi:hypothetical protein